MDKVILLFVAIVVLLGVSLSGMFKKSTTNTTGGLPVASVKCLDFDPPSTSNTVNFNNLNYGLIKSDAQILEPSKFAEMTPMGQVDGKTVYSMGIDYFGTKTDPNIIFVLKNIESKSPYVFDIYIKDGVPIPDYIKNCRSTGGRLTIVEGEENNFPPSAFNKAQVLNLTESTIAAGYIHNKNKTTLAFVNALGGSKIVGELFVKSKNRNYSLMFHLGTIYLMDGQDAYEYLPSERPIDFSRSSKESLQLKKLTFVITPSYSWWTPICKPAIYLYPQKRQNTNVKVKTKGRFTLTIPEYKNNGWDVVASPNGKIEFDNKLYPYLYYESEIPTAIINVPKNGFVVKFESLNKLFDSLLPRIGLAENEAREFSLYWNKALPYSSYYFVGVMENKDIDAIEPLEIFPNPDTVIRVRLYFKAIPTNIKVEEPVIKTPKRKGFSVVEWGGMVEKIADSSFTCGQ